MKKNKKQKTKQNKLIGKNQNIGEGGCKDQIRYYFFLLCIIISK